jgi:hypothetical protein
MKCNKIPLYPFLHLKVLNNQRCAFHSNANILMELFSCNVVFKAGCFDKTDHHICYICMRNHKSCSLAHFLCTMVYKMDGMVSKELVHAANGNERKCKAQNNASSENGFCCSTINQFYYTNTFQVLKNNYWKNIPSRKNGSYSSRRR